MTIVTEFSNRPRRNDTNGYMVVWQMVQELRDVFDKFQNKFLTGSATVTSGNTTTTVTHGLGNAAYKIIAAPTADPGGRWWISGKTASQFVLNLQVAAPGGGVSFDWFLKAG